MYPGVGCFDQRYLPIIPTNASDLSFSSPLLMTDSRDTVHQTGEMRYKVTLASSNFLRSNVSTLMPHNKEPHSTSLQTSEIIISRKRKRTEKEETRRKVIKPFKFSPRYSIKRIPSRVGPKC